METQEVIELEDIIEDELDRAIDGVFVEAHQLAGTKSGDITPHQTWQLDGLKEKLRKLIIEQVKQNL